MVVVDGTTALGVDDDDDDDDEIGETFDVDATDAATAAGTSEPTTGLPTTHRAPVKSINNAANVSRRSDGGSDGGSARSDGMSTLSTISR